MVSQDHLLCFSALLAWGLAIVAGNNCEKRAPVDCEEYFDPFDTGKREWRLAFRVTSHIECVLAAYEQKLGMPRKSQPGCMQVDPSLPCSHHYRNNAILDTWNNIDEVAVVLYKGCNRVQHIVFDAGGTSYMNWFTKAKVKYSSWTDLKTKHQDYFSIRGYYGSFVMRFFFISQGEYYCGDEVGWLAVTESFRDYACSWEKKGKGKPAVILYAEGTKIQDWTTGKIGQADILAIFVKERTWRV